MTENPEYICRYCGESITSGQYCFKIGVDYGYMVGPQNFSREEPENPMWFHSGCWLTEARKATKR